MIWADVEGKGSSRLERGDCGGSGAGDPGGGDVAGHLIGFKSFLLPVPVV